MEVRKYINLQLQLWDTQRMTGRMNSHLLRVYRILSGDVDCVPLLDWKRAFGMHLWFRCAPNESISNALASYEEAVQRGFSRAPLPPHTEARAIDGVYGVAEGQLDVSESQRPLSTYRDVLYELVTLYCRGHNSTHVLLPGGHSSWPLDYSLSWHLFTVLDSLGLTSDLDEHQRHLVHTSFIGQLEAAGLWQWAVYVALNLPNPTWLPSLRESAVREIINMHAPDMTTPLKEFLEIKLRIPRSLLDDAQSPLKAPPPPPPPLMDERDHEKQLQDMCSLVLSNWISVES